ncbi:MAG: IS607 family transposase [Ardenticatenales bacterium]|nr:IS607 family transposase [Ardenticatenales bacterium]
MKLSDYAREVGVSYHTAWRWYKAGKLRGYQMDTGTIIVTESVGEERATPTRVAVYARVSSHEMKENLERQAQRLTDYCAAKGWQVHRVVKEIGSGVNDTRPLFQKLLADESLSIIVVEHKDRATRFGFAYLETLLALQGRRIEVINLAENGREDLLQDLVSIIYSFSARLYGQRRGKRTAQRLAQELDQDG